jgi:hypothetical protein
MPLTCNAAGNYQQAAHWYWFIGLLPREGPPGSRVAPQCPLGLLSNYTRLQHGGVCSISPIAPAKIAK